MKKIHIPFLTFIVCLIFCFTGVEAVAQKSHHRFNPQKFEADMQQFIITKANLSQAEVARFLPLLKEMQMKQRVLFNQMRKLRHTNTQDDAACMKAIRQMDATDIQIKKLHQQYHQKFLKVLPAGKVMEVIKAEEKFHRKAFMRAVKRRTCD